MAISLTEMMVITTGFCGIISLIFYHLKRLHLYRAAAKFPGPPAFPIVGNAYFFAGRVEDILYKVWYLMLKYPSPYRVWLGNRLFFGVCDPDQMKTVLFSPKSIEKVDLFKYVRPWLGTGIFTAPAAKWKTHRRLIMPTFNQRILDSFVEIFVKQAEIMTQHMRKELNKGEFDVFNYSSLCTLDLICETAMGSTVKAQEGHGTEYVNSAKMFFEIAYTRMFKIWFHSDFIFNLTNLKKEQDRCVKYLHGFTNDVIRKKKNDYKNGTQAERATRTKAFLDLLIEGAKFTDEELREEVDTMMIAGNDTTATVNSFVMLMFANFPEIQEKVYQELCEIYGSEVTSDTPVKNEDLPRMEYMERVIKETMRLFPVGPILVRQITDDLDLGEHTLPKGSAVVLGVITIHRWEKYWPDPLKFDPDRFLPEEVAKRHPYCYMPFSAGPRNCVGLKYAMMAMKVFHASVLRRYVLKKDKTIDIGDIKLKADITLKPAEPVTIKIVERPKMV